MVCILNTPSLPLSTSRCLCQLANVPHLHLDQLPDGVPLLTLFLTKIHPYSTTSLCTTSLSTHMTARFGSQCRFRSIVDQSRLSILLGQECAPTEIPNDSTHTSAFVGCLPFLAWSLFSFIIEGVEF